MFDPRDMREPAETIAKVLSDPTVAGIGLADVLQTKMEQLTRLWWGEDGLKAARRAVAGEKVKVAIYVDGGNVTDVVASDPLVQVIMLDYDNIRGGDEEPEVPADVVHMVY